MYVTVETAEMESMLLYVCMYVCTYKLMSERTTYIPHTYIRTYQFTRFHTHGRNT